MAERTSEQNTKRIQYNKKYELVLAQCFRLGKHSYIAYRAYLRGSEATGNKDMETTHVWEVGQ